VNLILIFCFALAPSLDRAALAQPVKLSVIEAMMSGGDATIVPIVNKGSVKELKLENSVIVIKGESSVLKIDPGKTLKLGLTPDMDESGIVPDSDPTSAKYISQNGGVVKNAHSFYQLLMRYNFADPTIPAVGPGGIANPPAKPWPYALGATFPGLSIGMFLKPAGGYPNAQQLWPAPGEAPKIYFEPSTPPS